MKPASIAPVLIILAAYLIYKLGKEAAYGEVREAFGIEAEDDFADAQRANAGMQ